MRHQRPVPARIAQAIVEELFCNGSGERADRLVLMTREGRDLGGWGQGPVRDVIARVVAAHLGGAESPNGVEGRHD